MRFPEENSRTEWADHGVEEYLFSGAERRRRNHAARVAKDPCGHESMSTCSENILVFHQNTLQLCTKHGCTFTRVRGERSL